MGEDGSGGGVEAAPAIFIEGDEEGFDLIAVGGDEDGLKVAGGLGSIA